MAIELKVPVLPESVADATIADWHKKVGEAVSRDENLVDLETDKVVLEVPSPADGVLKEIKFQSGDTVTSEQILALIEEGAVAEEQGPGTGDRGPGEKQEAEQSKAEAPAPEKPAAGKVESVEVKVPVLPESVTDATIADWHKKVGEAVSRDENLVDLETDKVVLEVPAPTDGVLKEIKFETGDTVTGEQVLAVIETGAVTGEPGPGTGDRGPDEAGSAASDKKQAKAAKGSEDLSPAGRRVATEEGIDASKVEGTGRGGRVTKEDLVNYGKSDKSAGPRSPVPGPAAGSRPEERVPMTRIRARIAERLMQSKNSIAMLTSFNEINLAQVAKMRKTFGEQFKAEHGIKLGYMSFFVKAACEALKRHPVVNASVDGSDIIYHGYQDISIAVSTDKGLVTPVLRDAQDMSFAEIETAIADYAQRARTGKLNLDDLQGGTFTITNGGTFGSLLSTPIVNPPQSAILGMHTIKERAIVENGEVIAAPMMYIAISYDHRIIDGKDAVLFLVDIKDQLENPHRMLLGL